MIKVIENACTINIASLLYDRAISSTEWHFKFPQETTLENKHPKLDIIDNEIKNDFLAGVACSMLLNVFDAGGKDYFLPEIFYCGISIKDRHRKDNVHTDPANMKVLSILNPDWEKEWGGGFYYDGNTYDLKPGDFCIFDATKPHAAADIRTDKKRVAIDFWVRPINR